MRLKERTAINSLVLGVRFYPHLDWNLWLVGRNLNEGGSTTCEEEDDDRLWLCRAAALNPRRARHLLNPNAAVIVVLLFFHKIEIRLERPQPIALFGHRIES